MSDGRSKPRPNLSRAIFRDHHADLLAAYSEADAELIADLYTFRSFVMAGDFPRYVRIMSNFYSAEAKVGWQDHARRIVARAREIAP